MKSLSISRFIKASLLLSSLFVLAFIVFRVTKKGQIWSNMDTLRTDSEWATPAEVQYAINALVVEGPQAQESILEAIKSENSWDFRIFRYAEVMKKMGKPAHQSLLKTIDEEKKPNSRFRCVWVLQDAFHDYHKINKAISSLTDPSELNKEYQREYNAKHLRQQLFDHFQDDVPVVLYTDEQGKITRTLTDDFLAWYKEHKTSLPKLNLPNSQ